jgi:hypothetical protein
MAKAARKLLKLRAYLERLPTRVTVDGLSFQQQKPA